METSLDLSFIFITCFLHKTSTKSVRIFDSSFGHFGFSALDLSFKLVGFVYFFLFFYLHRIDVGAFRRPFHELNIYLAIQNQF